MRHINPESGKIYQGDCLEVMKPWPEGAVDVVFTDPPYSEQTHSGARTGKGKKTLVDFAAINSEFIVKLAARLCELSKRWVVMTCDWKHCAELAKKLPDEFIRAGVWIKPNGMPQYTGDRPAMGWEAVAILHRKGRKKWNGGGSHAVWNVPKVSGDHPTQKPLSLLQKWTHLFSDDGETILDPFCGSGTTLLAAEKMGRKWIGIEIDPKHIKTAQERLDAEMKQGKLF